MNCPTVPDMIRRLPVFICRVQLRKKMKLQLKQLKVKSETAKVDLFFKVMDTDGNGLLSEEEVTNLCLMSLSKFFAVVRLAIEIAREIL